MDHNLIYRMSHPKVPRAHFATLDRALRSAQLYGDLVAVNLGALGYPDLVAEIADLLLSYEGARLVLCIGRYGDHAYLSLRTEADNARAGSVMRQIVGHDGAAGGHGTMAGARRPVVGTALESPRGSQCRKTCCRHRARDRSCAAPSGQCIAAYSQPQTGSSPPAGAGKTQPNRRSG